MFVAFAGAMVGLSQWTSAASRNLIARSEIENMERELRTLGEKGEKIRQQLSPTQEQLMVASHKLVANKEFSWSRLLYDLETVLPGTVSASRINVENVYKENGRIKAELDLAVLAKDYQSVLQMIQNMNEKGIFKASLRGQDLQKSESFTYSVFTLRLTYSPRAGFAVALAPDVAMKQTRERRNR